MLVIAGPCVIESADHAVEMADRLNEITSLSDVDFVFKASYDKANRTELSSYRGPGSVSRERVDAGIRILDNIKETIGCKVTSDVHTVTQAMMFKYVLDIMQIPAHLCRQTDLLTTAGEHAQMVNIKKGQFASVNVMKHAIEKVGKEKCMITERGTTWGPDDLVVDMRSLFYMVHSPDFGVPILFDASHSAAIHRLYVSPLARAAVAVGVDGIFVEVHDNPDQALCDGKTSISIPEFSTLLDQVRDINKWRTLKKTVSEKPASSSSEKQQP